MIRTFVGKVMRQEPGIYSLVYRCAKSLRQLRMPTVRPLGAVLYYGRDIWLGMWGTLKARLVWEQMLRFRCRVGRNVELDGMPYVYGDGEVVIGDNVRIGNRNGWIVGLKVFPDAKLEIGDNSVIGYLNLFSVAKSVRIGKHCVFAGEVKILDNNSHSLDFEQRRINAPLVADEVAPVVIEDDVWIGANCTVLKGVTLGQGSVVAAGAVVTRSVPPFTVAAGNPARIIKHIEPHFSRHALLEQKKQGEQKDEPIDVHANTR
jgi:acetyltransferase-like isoleucine patch superfamily enzyme